MTAFDPQDTIAAIASPPGEGLRGIVRLSGPDAWPIALSGFLENRDLGSPKHPTRKPGHYRLDGLRNKLPADLLLWPGPKTYTGQPLAEIHTVGSSPLLALLLANCLRLGARLAEPGEFTLRAFLQGRIDLTQAEAVLGVIEAGNASQLDSALKQLAGGLFEPISRLRDHLLDTLAHLEANLDFMDEPDVDLLGRLQLAEDLARGSAELLNLADRLKSRERTEGHPRVVLVGPPNAGKSRLFNALVGSHNAIVSPVAGTTRDYLSAPCDCDGLKIELVDTAGEESARFAIEQQAQAHRIEQSERADLLLICSDVDDWDVVEKGTQPSLKVRTKADLRPSMAEEAPASIHLVSSETGQGLVELRRAIAGLLRARTNEADVPSSTAARCRDSLVRASESLGEAAEAIALELGDELVSIDLRQAVDDLGKVVGATVTDDILDRIFKRFCIGK